MDANPFDWSAFHFLIFYAVLILAGIVMRSILTAWLRSEGEPGRLSDENEIALLSGGRRRLALAVVVRLMVSGVLSISDSGRFDVATRKAGTTRFEKSLMELDPPFRWRQAQRALSGQVEQVEDDLVRRGLMMDRAEMWQVRLLRSVPLFFVLFVGYIRFRLGIIRGEDVGLLAAMMVLAGIFLIAGLFWSDRATKSAKAEIAALRAREDRLRRAPREAETGMAVALFGPAVLAGTPYALLHKTTGSSGCGSSSSDGGDGGSGCGGCGGCGG